MPKSEKEILCKNIFKSGQPEVSRDQFTGLWIRLINQLEKNKANLSVSPERNPMK